MVVDEKVERVNLHGEDLPIDVLERESVALNQKEVREKNEACLARR